MTKSAAISCETVKLGVDIESRIHTPRQLERERVQAASVSRSRRWKLREAAQDILGGRICQCGVKPVPNKEIGVRRKDGKAYYSGLRSCGSVWTCPVCSAKISKRRADELRRGLGNHLDRGGVVTMMTLTVQHQRSDDLKDLLERMSKAQRWFYQGRWYQELKAQYGIVGTVRNLEATWGQRSGWHPHSHVLLLSTSKLDSRELFERWARACERYGLWASWDAFQHGVSSTAEMTLENKAADVSKYLTKMFELDDKGSWTAAEELTLAHYKRSNTERFTPYDLLRGVLETGDALLAYKFQEFADAYKGKRQLYWSKGLRDALGLGTDQTDEELANVEDEGGELLFTIARPVWRYVVRAKLRREVLEWVETHGVAYVQDFLSAAVVTGLHARAGPPNRMSRQSAHPDVSSSLPS